MKEKRKPAFCLFVWLGFFLVCSSIFQALFKCHSVQRSHPTSTKVPRMALIDFHGRHCQAVLKIALNTCQVSSDVVEFYSDKSKAITVNHQSHFLGDEKNPSSPFSLIRVWKNENPVLESVYVLLLPCLFSQDWILQKQCLIYYFYLMY